MASTATVLRRDEPQARAGMYGLLARIWDRETDCDLLNALHEPTVRESFEGAGGELPPQGDATAEELAIDYCRLFVGPRGHLPPFQSVWEEGQFEGSTASSMKSFSELVNWPSDVDVSGSMVDHLATQLQLQGIVLAQIAATVPDSDEAGLLWELAEAFFAAHLRWPHELLCRAEERAETGYYRSVAAMTARFLASESV